MIDFNPLVFRTLTDRGMHVIYGDISNVDTLVHAGVGKAEMIILSVPDSLLKGASNEKLVRHVRSLNPTAKIVATAEFLADVNDLYAAGADYVTVTRLSDAHELYTVIEAAEPGCWKTSAPRWTRCSPSAARCCRRGRSCRLERRIQLARGDFPDCASLQHGRLLACRRGDAALRIDAGAEH